MEDFKGNSISDLLKIVQLKVKDNNLAIQKNVRSVELVKKNYSPSEKRNKIIDSINRKNISLTKENIVLLELYNSIFKFYNDYKSLLERTTGEKIYSIEISKVNWEDYKETCMKRTIDGNLRIDLNHPFLNDKEFLSELMNRCTQMELYERCSEIKQIQNATKMHI
jgi:hypothetical protein